MIRDVPGLARHLESALRSEADVAVVGVSGGVDSAVVASISVAALGKQNVYVVSMPYDDADRHTFNSRSAELANFLGSHHLVVSIGSAVDALMKSFGTEFEKKEKGELHRLTHGNTRARMRMTTLYALAGELSYRFSASSNPVRGEVFAGTRVRVIGTGNASEDLIGYDTKGGDALADFFVIGDLFKSEVYQLARHYKVPQSILNAPPSAGLYPGQTDEQELGFSYDELEGALNALHKALAKGVADADLAVTLSEFSDIETAKAQFVISRFRANAHKHRAPKLAQVRDSGFFA